MRNDRGRGDDDTKSEKQAAAGGHGWKRFQRFRARGSSRNQMRRRSDQFPLAGGAAPLMGSPNLDAHDIASRCNSPHRLASRQDTKAGAEKNSRAAPAESTQFKGAEMILLSRDRRRH